MNFSLALLQYSYTDNNRIVAYAQNEETSLPTLLNYLSNNNVIMVPVLPDKGGVFCVMENGIRNVYQNAYDKESGVILNIYQYSLNWISIKVPVGENGMIYYQPPHIKHVLSND